MQVLGVRCYRYCCHGDCVCFLCDCGGGGCGGYRPLGPDEPIHVRRDSTWDVPEPELAIFMSSSSKIVGYTIGNDVSSRYITTAAMHARLLPSHVCISRPRAAGECARVCTPRPLRRRPGGVGS